ncbi:related to extracellular serine-rich protein [Cephalotrichum gorgonifer]|uniref:Related to extracellular serine-rich protein n=1 Tax=Cephalotrichum gorgonifer TaxID=2041049 RepID=A0AAE8MXB0_9PEZI|nr:related to extracellular serine-rich protein [Cephalotrichum gorgonifer]
MRFSLRALGALGSLVALCAPTVNACIRTVDGKILVLARTAGEAKMAAAGLEGYGITYEAVGVPQEGFTLPQLNSSASLGNYGGIVILSEVSYQYSDGWRSALTETQLQTLYTYQTDFGVRMVRLDVYPTAAFGATPAGSDGCCAAGVDQPISITDDSDFPTANLKTGAGVSTVGLWHIPSTIVDTTIAKEFAQFAPSGSFSSPTTAGVINTFGTRQQMVFFISWATDWAISSNYLQHAWIHWVTRGVFSGKRKIYLGTQVDDVHLATEIYYPSGNEFRIRTADLDAHVSWMADINTRLPAGSEYFVELAHNGNGAIEAATADSIPNPPCNPNTPVWYDEIPEVAHEWKKPLGTGIDYWPSSWTTYPWAQQCPASDPFASWFLNAANRNKFAHVSHTFTHEEMNNATYHDAVLEIQFNQAWLTQMGYTSATHWSPHGIVPPAITGLYNGDAIRAWMENGINFVVGDNTRSALRNPESTYWPLITNEATHGHAGLVVVPRWATTIYYNCDTPECTYQEWADTSAGSGGFTNLLRDAKETNTRYLLQLHPDPFMFHQANMRQDDMPVFTVGPVTQKMSLLQIWTETVTQELTRLTDWPIRTLKHDDIAQLFLDRKALDQCHPKIEYIFSTDTQTITGVNVHADGDSCGVPVPVTLAGAATASSGGVVIDQVGSEPIVAWTSLSGSAVSLTFNSPIPV